MTTVDAAPNPEIVFNTMLAYQRTYALKAAIELDVFTAIAGGAATVDQIAERCKASVRGTRMLCDYLVVAGLLDKTGDRYAVTPDSGTFLSKSSPAYLGTMMSFLNTPSLMRNIERLTETVRRGTVTQDQDMVSTENPVWEEFARSMTPLMFPNAQAMGDILGVASAGPLKVLDIAAGHGIFGIVIAQKNPQADVHAVDWKNVLKVATANAQKMGVGARHHTIEGDAFTVDYGSGYDLALVTNFLHHFDAPTCTTVMRKVAAALKPGGRAAILEFVPNDDRVTPPMPASFVMNMLSGTPAGDAYTFRELTAMLEDAGLSKVARHALPTPETLIVATK